MALNSIQKETIGQTALKYFNDFSAHNFDDYQYDYPTLIRKLKTQNTRFFEMLGSTIADSHDSEDQIQKIFEGIAVQNKGQIPSHLSDFMKPFSDPRLAEEVSSFTILKDTVEGTAAIVGDGAVAFGNGVIGAVKLSAILIPLAAAFAIGIIVFHKGKALE